jgi:hypothetical protein
MEKLLVLPFKDMYRVYGDSVSFRCPLCNRVYLIGPVAEGADRVMTERLISLVKTREEIELISPSQGEGVMSGLLSESEKELPELTLLVETGRALEADAVMIGRLYRFRERRGTGYSVESPASVSFDLLLIRVGDGRLLWNAHFDETQQSLFENLLKFGTFLKRKGRWITAEEMGTSGLEEVFQTFPEP